MRVRVSVDPRTDLNDPRPIVFAFWHGQQMLLLAARSTRRRPRGVMVSWSRDGALQSGVMRALGFRVVRGSSSRGGAGGLRGLLRVLRHGGDSVFAVDGPRGPAFQAKRGAALAAVRADALLVPIAASRSSGWRLSRAWDRFEIPRPFSRVVVVVGAPIPAVDAAKTPDMLSGAIQDSCRQARAAFDSTSRAPRLLSPSQP